MMMIQMNKLFYFRKYNMTDDRCLHFFYSINIIKLQLVAKLLLNFFNLPKKNSRLLDKINEKKLKITSL